MKNVVIIGATSAIATEVARYYSHQKATLYLVARHQDKLSKLANDLTVRGASTVHQQSMDLTVLKQHAALIQHCQKTLDTIDILLIAHGMLPNQSECNENTDALIQSIGVNALSVLSLLNHFAPAFESQQQGQIGVITSVAGNRGRQSNYGYGSAKGMVSIFLQGLRNRLSHANVSVLDIKPGFVDTPMTEQFSKGLLWSKPEKVAKDIVKALQKHKNYCYTPWFWRPIMWVIKAIPERIFNKLSL